MKQIEAREAIELLRTMTRVLFVVGILALVFTTVNVTRFATSRHVPLPIAILLDPMIGTALAGVLYVDAHLAAWGIRPPAWSTTLRWSAGSTAALMNTWESCGPTDRSAGRTKPIQQPSSSTSPQPSSSSRSPRPSPPTAEPSQTSWTRSTRPATPIRPPRLPLRDPDRPRPPPSRTRPH
ncbi:hypothetical protein [Streptomyces sp. ISID311]|uniref:hypothetical protein n=1 Tax=Streptomyces sp. ISID311 TaxID=2601673 RepID=UPI0021C424D0|nr:hypothetical protein [Streptomyces sp. ISID311]